MKTLPISRYRFYQQIQPLSILKRITSKSVTGCLQVFTTSGSWSVYIDEGRLFYACYSERMFEPLYRKLQHLSQQVSTLPRGINEQLRAIFEISSEGKGIPNPDYLAICWLVNQKYISPFQAAVLIEQLTLEILESFLQLQEGSYEFVPDSFLDDLPKFCYLNLSLLLENSQLKLTELWQPNHSNEEPSEKKIYKIFCIDDSSILLNTIQSFLDEQIFSVLGVNDPLKALMEILTIKPDLILLDVAVPNLNGYEVCALLRKNPYFKTTPIIMVTDKTGLIDRAKARIVGANGTLFKPFTQGDVLKIIFQHIV